ncbi:MAG: DUF5606 domain-containing protein [Lewinellaceae bacterium]|nr:DUF5606 domain-containing protein [Lewinellaceae bacterium]
MNLSKIIAVSGLPGLYSLVSTKSNGLIVSDIDSGKSKFCSVREHQFTPMETVAIYTEMDTVAIEDVFRSILKNLDSKPSPNASHTELKSYFEIIIPDYDRDRVFHSDMKKVIKWFNFLYERGLLTDEVESPKDEEE